MDPVAPLPPGQLDTWGTGVGPVVVLLLDPQAAVTSNIGSANRAATGIRTGLFISSCRASLRTVQATRRQSVRG
jgi:hypothetical protein